MYDLVQDRLLLKIAGNFNNIQMAKFEIIASATKPNLKPVRVIEALQQVYRDSVPCKSVIYDWMIERFKVGRVQLDDDPQGWRSTAARGQDR
ncbi:unnamed protein product [Rodentolepis nana]|uniref:H15 domain-containing protein n=1 Tax=Rodentolepis nana TaxID=102285 RepID=A0A0R3TQM3_RODNA|nr:unnamed protein product [Rodentolepis nana]